ncbi:SDR family NAD(P)-dependent oxidoreductase [Nonomuraea sp. NPDC050556]|uniref:SDR family NAD(P)-dependent oxidoreductase n=1 Tax=Nonomuraea sp. NPDC050556 TaxID=3364369 RepID=UPI0037B9AC18
MPLEGKNAVIYGGAGAIGGAAARAFAASGARVFAVEHTLVDALDEDAVTRHAAEVRERAGSIDICLNAVGLPLGSQGVPLVELAADAAVGAVSAYIRTNFVTAKAAALHMRETGGGVILALSPPMARNPVALSGPFGMAGAAVEGLVRQLAAELGAHGVRAVGMRLNGIPETASRLGSHTAQMWGRAAERLGVPYERLLEQVGAGTFSGRPLTVRQVADVAVFLASDRAGGVTGTVVNVTGGAGVD